jgi:hypothetical protein
VIARGHNGSRGGVPTGQGAKGQGVPRVGGRKVVPGGSPSRGPKGRPGGFPESGAERSSRGVPRVGG